MRLIDVLLEEYGHINRRVFERYFDLSTQQVSLDFRTYMEWAPGNMEYDARSKTYRRTAQFKRQWL